MTTPVTSDCLNCGLLVRTCTARVCIANCAGAVHCVDGSHNCPASPGRRTMATRSVRQEVSEMTAGEGRWDRLAADLSAAGIGASVDVRPYPGGISRSITIRTSTGLVVIDDKWWHKNADVWIGWQVTLEGADSIVRWGSKLTKKRSEVVTAARFAMERQAPT